MAKKPLAPKPSVLGALVWGWSRTPQYVKWIGSIGTVAGAIYAVAQAAPIAEPILPAHRAWVREVTEPVLQRVIKMQLAQNDERRQRLLDEVQKREIELQSPQVQQLPQYKNLVQQRVDRIKSELKTIDEQNNNLFKEQKTK
jgi:hypothetical protein